MAHVLSTVRAHVGRLLARRHLEPADDTAPAGPLAEVRRALGAAHGEGNHLELDLRFGRAYLEALHDELR